MNNRLFIGLVAVIVALGALLRLFRLDGIPAGLHVDEASLGYDAYTLLVNGTDQYGWSWPVFLRSFGDYKSPLYSYLSVPIIWVLGLSVQSIRILSAVGGVAVVVLTALVINLWFKSKSLTLICSLVIAISPWAIFYSRAAVETNLGLSLFLLGVYFISLFLFKGKFIYFFLSSLSLSLSVYAYHSERVLSVLFLFLVVVFFWKKFRINVVLTGVGVMLFVLVLLPQLLLWQTDAFSRRLGSVNYFSEAFFEKHGGEYKDMFLGRFIYVSREFLSQYISYLSPRNLFFDADSQSSRSVPGMSVFYNWMLVPFLVGVGALILKKKSMGEKMLFLTVALSVVPAAMTRDAFYTLRVLPLFWGVGIIIGFGLVSIGRMLGNRVFVVALGTLVAYSLYMFYGHYFVLFRVERSGDYGYQFLELVKKLDKYEGRKIVIDNTTAPAVYIYWLFQKRVSPEDLKDQGKFITSEYYNLPGFDTRYSIGNVEIRPIDWVKDSCGESIIVGDYIGAPQHRVAETGLQEVDFAVDLSGGRRWSIYQATEPCRD